jgi:hypothetical protein
VKWGADLDLTRKRAQRMVRGWIRSGKLIAVWMGTPCSTWSRARDRPGGPPPLRSKDEVLGLTELNEADRVRVTIGNVLMKFSASILHLCNRHKVPCVMENPSSSRIWLAEPIAKLLQHRHFNTCELDFCLFNVPWRKTTRLLGVHLDLEPLAGRCSGRQTCSTSGLAHVVLSGLCNGVWRTAIAEAYPRQFARAAVLVFASARAASVAKLVGSRFCSDPCV